MKKILISIIVLSLFAISVNATEVIIENQDYTEVGKTFNVVVKASSEDVIGGYVFDSISWNPNVISARDIFRGETVWSMFDNGTFGNGNITDISTCCGYEIVLGDVTLFTITFDAIGNGTTDIKIDGYLFDWYGLPTHATFINSSITVGYNTTIDTDGDGVPDVDDGCPTDPNKIEPGNCGCGIPETDCGNNGENGGSSGGGGGGYTPPPENKNPVAVIDIPNEKYTNETVNFSGVNSYDEDGDTLSYVWLINGEIIYGMDGQIIFEKDGVFPFVLKVTDGNGGEGTATDYITILKQSVDESDQNDTDEPDNNQTDNETNKNITEYNGNVTGDENYWVNPLFIVILVVAIFISLLIYFKYRRRL